MHQTRQLFDGRRLANDGGRIFFQDPDISKNIFRFPASPAINDTLGAYRLTSGTGKCKFSGDTIQRSGDIRARAEASAIGGKWRRRGKSQEDDHGLTFEISEFGVREPNSSEIGLAVFEKRSYGRTHRQTESFSLLEILCDWDSRVA